VISLIYHTYVSVKQILQLANQFDRKQNRELDGEMDTRR